MITPSFQSPSDITRGAKGDAREIVGEAHGVAGERSIVANSSAAGSSARWSEAA